MIHFWLHRLVCSQVSLSNRVTLTFVILFLEPQRKGRGFHKRQEVVLPSECTCWCWAQGHGGVVAVPTDPSPHWDPTSGHTGVWDRAGALGLWCPMLTREMVKLLAASGWEE